jgi:hypothetical protein
MVCGPTFCSSSHSLLLPTAADLSYSTLGVSSTGVLYVFAASQLYAIDPLAGDDTP